jgi:sugar lactone lactonase YvrE
MSELGRPCTARADVCHRYLPTSGGAVLRTVTLDRGGFACALGGPAGTTLFIVAAPWRRMSELVAPGSGQVLVTEVDVPGAGWL